MGKSLSVNAKPLRVNGDRLWSRLMQMAEIGATPHGGCNRQALTDADMAGRRLLSGWAEAAGCRVRVDAVGNLFIRRPGRDDTLPVAMMGSAVWSGRLPLDTAYGLTDRNGISVRHELQRAGIPTDAPLSRQPVKASFEVHIEQGPVLEQKAKTIGVVTGVQHMSRHEVVVEGQEAHAGPTPMDMRRDPIRVLADLLPALYAATERRGRDARLTVGFIETLPGSPNTVPGRLRFTVDVRHPDAAVYGAL